MADYRAKIQRKSQALLRTGEPVLATVRATVEGSPIGALGGLPALLALAADQRSHVEAQGFPASMHMVLAVTDRRLLVFRLAFGRLHGLRGEVPLDTLHGASLERRGLSPRLRFVLASGAEMTFTTYRLDHPDEFIRVVKEARARQRGSTGNPSSRDIPSLPPPPPP